MLKRMKRLFSNRNNRGFTLVEVIVSTVLLGVLIVGIVFFISPLFQNVNNSIDIERADRVATTMQQYLTKSMKNAQFVKVFTNASINDIDELTDAIYVDPDFEDMREYLDQANVPGAGGGSIIKRYRLCCISLRYQQDLNPRNSTNGLPEEKYVLTRETVGTTTPSSPYLLDKTQSVPVFEMAFYERLFPQVNFERLTVDITPAGASTPVIVGPAFETTINMYDEASMDINSLLFSGKGIIEFNNIKSTEINSKQKFKTFPTTDLGTGTDTFIFYIIREHV